MGDPRKHVCTPAFGEICRRSGSIWALLLALGISLATVNAAAAEQKRLTEDWRVHRGEAAGAEQPAFDDHGWQRVSVPHDISVMDKADGSPPFDAKAEAGQDSGYLPGGVGWYRRHLVLNADEAARIVQLRFEAVYMDADIWLNGQKVASHKYGYTAFAVDLTGKVRAGENVIAVRVNHPDPSSRWYAGTGIIRPVTLDVLNCVHIVPESVFVTTPVATTEAGVVAVDAAASNCAAKQAKVELVSKVVSPTGETVARTIQSQTVGAKAKAQSKSRLDLAHPKLWSPDAPNLYTLVQELRVDGVVVDERRTRFGMRTVTIDAVNGLRLNGKPLELRGGNIHHDNYMLGAAGLPDADRRKVALMKAAGYNAIRNAHNPASQATLEAADELGMLVINEAFDSWNKSKRSQDYSRFFAENWAQDIDSLVISGRNHPSVIFWSIGNEIPEDGTPEGVATGQNLAARVRQLDPTRPVTQGVNADPPKSSLQFDQLDVAGYNYKAHQFDEEHKNFPNRVLYTSESAPKDAFSYWRAVETKPWVIGDFVWTAVDYLGEAGIGWMGYSQDWQKLGPYPWNLAYCGEIDATGRKRPAAYYRQVIWKTGIDPVAAFVRQPKGTEDLPDRDYFPTTPPHLDWSLDDVHPSWTWPGQEGKPQEVVVYSEYPEVELFLNGKSLGRQAVSVATEYKASYSVPYQAGQLLAVGYRDGKEAGRWELRTAGVPATAKATIDRTQLTANGQDLAYVTMELFDADGTPVYARGDERRVKVRVLGAGRLAGFGNGDPQDISSLQSGERMTFHGRAVAVVQAGTEAGDLSVQIEVEGMPLQRIRLSAVSGN
jgi:beta-galactosidase